MKRKIIVLSVLLLAALGIGLWLRAKKTATPVSLRILQTRSALDNPALQKLFGQQKDLVIEVHFREAQNLREKAGTESLADFDLVLTDAATLGLLEERKNVAPDPTPLYEEGYQVLYVNRKLASAVPATWNDLVGQTAAQASQSLQRFGLAIPSEAYAALPFVARAFWDENGHQRKEPEAEALEEGIETIKTLRYTFSLTPRDCSAECATQLFLNGQAPFAVAGDWRWQTFQEKMGDELGIAPLPRMEGGASLSPRLTAMLGISRALDPVRREAAQKVQAFFQTHAGASQLFDATGKFPSFWLKETPASRRAQELAAVIQQSTLSVDENISQELLAKIRDPIRSYFEGQLASTETIDLLSRTTQ